MTNRIASWLAALIVLACAVDIVLFGTEHVIFLGKKLLEFIEWLAFWR